MIKNPAIVENLKKLSSEGVLIVPTQKGELACKEIGEGKLADIELIRDFIIKALTPQRWKAKRVLITLGATREYMDPVRFLTNKSSGKMGLALAKAIFYQGGIPVLVAGDTRISIPQYFEIHRVETAEEMLEKCLQLFGEVSAVFMNSAVVDFKFKTVSPSKIKKKEGSLTVELEPTVDILKTLGELKERTRGKKKENSPLLVGFAVETENLVENALKKLKEKNLDAIIVNPVGVIGEDHYEGILLFPDGERKYITVPSKEEGAFRITELVAEKFFRRDYNS
jgi:phosphopantothenoylcysteine decarboxylase/phosphopantothenate--cysteine ligase